MNCKSFVKFDYAKRQLQFTSGNKTTSEIDGRLATPGRVDSMKSSNTPGPTMVRGRVP